MYSMRYAFGVLAMPLSIGLILALVGAACHLRRRRVLTACFYVSGAAVAYLGSTAIAGNALLRPLEQAYPSIRDAKQLSAATAIVVLGSSYAPRNGIPITGALDEHGVVRLVEGVRLRRELGSLPIVVSGGAPYEAPTPAQGYMLLALQLGVPSASIIMLPRALDTAEEARDIVRLLGTAPFILVTSAYHMPRAMRLMKRAGAQAIPAPTDQQIGARGFSVWALLPNSVGLSRSELALHEYLGMAAMALGYE